MRKFTFILIFFFASTALLKSQVLDRVVAIVGEEIILKSDIDNQYSYMVASGQEDDGTLRCGILENLIIAKLLYAKAGQDSLTVSDDQVESEVNRRIMQFSQSVGGEEQLEKIYGKAVLEIKQDLRPEIRQQLLVDQQRQQIMNEVNVTPKEVREFYKSIPEDSLPYLPAEVELYHIVMTPPYSQDAKTEAREKLKGIREDIVENDKDFGTMARITSMGPSRKDDGYLGEFGRGQMVPEFDDVVFNLKEDEISEVFETQFGYHIVQLHKRLGDRVRASHILIQPERKLMDDQTAKDKLSEIRKKVMNDEMGFQEAALEYSEDPVSKDCGGCIKDQQTGQLMVSMDQLDSDLFLKVDEMQVGEISKPSQRFVENSSEKLFHIIYLKDRKPPHVANLKEDYQKLQKAALQNKQMQKLQDWLKKARSNIYIEIMDEQCASTLKNWF